MSFRLSTGLSTVIRGVPHGSFRDRMYALIRQRGHVLGFMPEAMSGVDIDLFDLAGRALDVHCYALLGGLQQERVRTCASVLQWLEPEALAEVAARCRDAGFTATKLKVGQAPAIDRRKVEAARGAVGSDGLVLLCHKWGWWLLWQVG